ncbi:acyltransferase [Sansalvadorimonas verongulae]|uniref:acyltransferase n=1 Tax=Sansalvadorimonas verongulae TaxID=2172824 RepID=UPI0012BB9483|nr:acyltransferase [Sansalvadorimonas verongulae]MTI13495.1 acyltransferase [Sansalvadorimonas verongulae]
MGERTTSGESTENDYFYIELLRAVAAFAVVVIHTLGPYRHWIGQIPDYDWLSAISLNVGSRWAVPVFIMITGALMLPDKRRFNLHYYFSRRVSKVLIPFLVWSVIYAFLAGVVWSSHGVRFDLFITLRVLDGLPYEETWEHLGFYYYFIPLYLVIPFLTPWVQQLSDDQLRMLVLAWMVLTLFYLLQIQSHWMIGTVMYGGYLPLGYALTRMPLEKQQRIGVYSGALFAVAAGVYGIWEISSAAGNYAPGLYTSYKTLNTVIVAMAVFVLCFQCAEKIQGRCRKVIRFVGQHSLGLYLIHPLVLWPVQNLGFFPGFTLISIPLMAMAVTAVTLFIVWWLRLSRATAWMVP